MPEAFICDALRMPIGRHAGAIPAVRADDLAALRLAALMRRNRGGALRYALCTMPGVGQEQPLVLERA